MEIGDIFVVNKADREGADRAAQAIAANLSLGEAPKENWKPPIVMTEATRPLGVDELWRQIGRYREHMADQQADRRRERQSVRLRELMARTLVRQVEASLPAGEIERHGRPRRGARARSVCSRWRNDPTFPLQSAGRGRRLRRPFTI